MNFKVNLKFQLDQIFWELDPKKKASHTENECQRLTCCCKTATCAFVSPHSKVQRLLQKKDRQTDGQLASLGNTGFSVWEPKTYLGSRDNLWNHSRNWEQLKWSWNGTCRLIDVYSAHLNNMLKMVTKRFVESIYLPSNHSINPWKSIFFLKI